MHAFTKRQGVALVGLMFVGVLSGCTNYGAQVEALRAENDSLVNQKQALAAKNQKLLDDLQRQIEQGGMSESNVLRFGDMNDVVLNPDEGTITVSISDSLLFDSGKASLKSSTVRELDKVISILKQEYPGRKVDVVGHTDSDPIKKTADQWKDNLELSAQRALSVARYLIDHGIPEKDVMAGGCGAARPRPSDTTGTQAAKAKNRRVEIVVHLRG